MSDPVPQSIDFEFTPPIGTFVMLKGQRYELVRLEAYTRQDGGGSTLLVWRSRCATCADLFEAPTTLKGSPSRRCPEYRAAGRQWRHDETPPAQAAG